MIKNGITFRFAGSREYVRGTDVYTAVVDVLGSEGLSDIRFTFSAPIQACQCGIYMDDSEAEIAGLHGIKVKGSAEKSGKPVFFAVQEEVTSAGCERYGFDEDAIVANARYAELSVEQSPLPNACTPIEIVVALTKALHNKLYPPESGKWIVTKLELPRPMSFCRSVKVEIKHNFHMRLTKSEIIADGDHAGYVYFSLAVQ